MLSHPWAKEVFVLGKVRSNYHASLGGISELEVYCGLKYAFPGSSRTRARGTWAGLTIPCRTWPRSANLDPWTS